MKEAELEGTAGIPVESLWNCDTGLPQERGVLRLRDPETIVSCVRGNVHFGKLSVEFPEMSCTWERCKHFRDLLAS